MRKFDLALWLLQSHRIFCFLNVRDRIHDFKHTLCRIDTVRPHLKYTGEEIHRSIELSHITDKCDQHAEFNISGSKKQDHAYDPYPDTGNFLNQII